MVMAEKRSPEWVESGNGGGMLKAVQDMHQLAPFYAPFFPFLPGKKATAIPQTHPLVDHPR